MSDGTTSGPPEAGDSLGPYRLETAVGAGGIAEVWRARGPRGPEDYVAVKVLLHDRVVPEEIERLRREFETLQRFDHPNIVRVLEQGVSDGYPWFAMEYVEGIDLQALLDAWKEAPPRDRTARAAAILEDLCEALEVVHEAGVVHRDLKPSNVLVDTDGTARLTDFGGIKAPDAFETQLTVAGRLVGTVAFMAPEQITGDPVDARTDLYALGAVLYALLTGRLPVEAETIQEFLTRHLTETPSAPAQLAPGVPPRMSRICERLLRKDPDQRFASARQVLDALHAKGADGPTLRGRQRALEALEQALSEAAAGQGGALAIEGAEGSGRTALLAEVTVRARENSLACATLSPTELALPIPPPPLLLVDDLHTARPVAIRSLTALLAESSGTLLIWTADPSRARRDAATALNTLRAVSESLPLPPLPLEEIAAWLREQGLPPAHAAALSRRLHAACGGAPGATHEQLDALVDAGWLSRDDAGQLTVLAAPRALRKEPMPMPRRRRAAVRAALSRLPRAAVVVAERLAVLDEAVTTDLLEKLAPGAAAHLEALADAELLQRREEGLHQVVDLPGAQIRALLYEGIPAERRAEMHRETGRALAERRRRRRGAARVAGRHLLLGGSVSEAWPLLLEAAERSARRERWAEVLPVVEAALAAAEAASAVIEPARFKAMTCALMGLKGQALLASDRPREAAAALTEARGMTTEPVSTLDASLGRALLAIGTPEAAIPLLRAALEGATEDETASIRLELARAYAGAGDPRVGAAWSSALEGATGPARGRVLLGRGTWRLELGALSTATKDLLAAQQALGEAKTPDSRALSECQLQQARLALAAGRLKEAFTLASEAEILARDTDDLPRTARSGAIKARALAALGRSDDARAAAGSAAALGKALGGALPSEVAGMGPLGSLPADPDATTAAIDRIPLLLAAVRQRRNTMLLAQAEASMPEGAEGLALEIALTAGRAGIAGAMARLMLERLDGDLADSFRSRPDIAEVLA